MPDTSTLPLSPSRPLSHPRALLAITLLTLPVLLILLGTGDPVDMMELFNLIPVREAFRDHHWLMPTLNGAPRLEKPPLPVWIPAALATLFHSESLWILRIPSILMALLTSFATYASGCTLFDHPDDKPHRNRTYALLAALLLPTMIMFNREARLATYDIYATAFLTCAAFFLIRLAERTSPSGLVAGAPYRNRSPIRRFLDSPMVLSILAGFSTGLSILCKGPVPVATVMLPLGLWLLIYHRRPKIFVHIVLAALISLCTFMPWLIAIGGIPHLVPAQYPDAWRVWYSELFQFGTGNAAAITAGTKAQLTDPKWYYLQMFYWVAPLTPTFIAALLLPFLQSQGDPPPAPREQRGRLLLWLILVLGLLLLTVPSEKKPRYALQLFPYAALLCAAVWQEFLRFPAEKKTDLPAQIMLAAQALFFIVPGFVGLCMTALDLTHLALPFASTFTHVIDRIGWIKAGMLFVAITAIGIYLWRLCAHRRFSRAMPTFAIASLLFIFTAQYLYKSDPATHSNPVKGPMEALLEKCEPGAPLYTLPEARPWLSTLYFSNQILIPLIPDALIERVHQVPTKDIYLLIITDPNNSNALAPIPSVQASLDKIAAATSRHWQFLCFLSDENRQTALFKLPALPISSSPTRP